MSALKKTAIGLSLIAMTAFGAKAQNANDNRLAFNDSAKTEVTNENTPVVKTGSPGEAQTLSIKNKSLVIHISGGSNEKYTAEQYATMLQAMFKDEKRTDFPTDVSVVFEESDADRPTGSFIYLMGYIYDRNGGKYEKGDGLFHPYEIVPAIAKITESFDQKKKEAVISLTDAQASVRNNDFN